MADSAHNQFVRHVLWSPCASCSL